MEIKQPPNSPISTTINHLSPGEVFCTLDRENEASFFMKITGPDFRAISLDDGEHYYFYKENVYPIKGHFIVTSVGLSLKDEDKSLIIDNLKERLKAHDRVIADMRSKLHNMAAAHVEAGGRALEEA